MDDFFTDPMMLHSYLVQNYFEQQTKAQQIGVYHMFVSEQLSVLDNIEYRMYS